jgi:hypothetical protein
VTKALERAASIARSENLGEMLLHTKPTWKDSSRYVLLGLLCVLPGILMLAIVSTSEKNAISAGGEWIVAGSVAGSVAVGCIAAAGFIFYAFKKSRHQILLHERGLVELRGNQIHSVKYEDLQISQRSVQLSAYGVVPIAKATDYTMQFPNGTRSSVDWSQGSRPVGEIIQDLIYQHQISQAIAAIAQGQDVVFGQVRLNNQSLSIGRTTLLWSEVDRVQLVGGKFYIFRPNSQRFAASIEFGSVPNAFVLLALLQRLGK